MKNINKYSLAITLLLLMGMVVSSCTERIDVELDDTYVRLVVDGQITSDATSQHKVILSKSTSYFYNQPPPPVVNADVQIIDEGGNAVLLSEEEPGVYLLPRAIRPRQAKFTISTYSLVKKWMEKRIILPAHPRRA